MIHVDCLNGQRVRVGQRVCYLGVVVDISGVLRVKTSLISQQFLTLENSAANEAHAGGL